MKNDRIIDDKEILDNNAPPKAMAAVATPAVPASVDGLQRRLRELVGEQEHSVFARNAVKEGLFTSIPDDSRSPGDVAVDIGDTAAAIAALVV